MPPVAFTKRSDSAIRFDKDLGRCIGWACFSKKAGEPYVDLHGDHFPDDELLKAVDGLMKQPIEKREINVEHAGAARGTIVTAWALTEDVAKALQPPIDTGGTYGVLVSFEPDAELKKSIEAGEMICLSIEGKAHDVEQVAKSAGETFEASKHKRTMRKVELTKLAVVKAGAHEGAQVAILKAAQPSDAVVAFARGAALVAVPLPVAKRTPVMTAPQDGHQHLIGDVEEQDGFTSWETASSDQYGHSHPWVRKPDGSIHIGEANGHSHEIEETTMPTDIEKAQADLTAARADFAKRESVLKTLLVAAVALPAVEAAYCKRLAPADVEAFLAKSADERAKLATPIHKSERTGQVFFAGQEDLAAVVKDSDATHAELAKTRAANEAAAFEKRAGEVIPHWKGTLAERAAIVKAIETGIADEAVRKSVLEAMKAADHAFEQITKAVGYAGGGQGGSRLDDFEKGLESFAKAAGKKADEMADVFLGTPEGQRLYKAYEDERAALIRGGN